MATYKGYTADIKVDESSLLLVGRVLDIKDRITFHGKTVDSVIKEFEKSIDSYLKFCEELGQKPDKPFSGKLPFRTTPDFHREIYLASAKSNKSINAWMEDTLKIALQQASASFPSVERILENEDTVQALLAQVSDLLIDNNPIEKEKFIDALEHFLIGLDEIRPFIQDSPGGEKVVRLVREIYFFLGEGESSLADLNSPTISIKRSSVPR